jgi:hypothetical protein
MTTLAFIVRWQFTNHSTNLEFTLFVEHNQDLLACSSSVQMDGGLQPS